ncbi:hypothetical protein GJ496_000903 [Pomphorhynchus laevis]|nr:hypothetical protein GJ496_000903 [Pomphorhynchus laevis]
MPYVVGIFDRVQLTMVVFALILSILCLLKCSIDVLIPSIILFAIDASAFCFILTIAYGTIAMKFKIIRLAIILLILWTLWNIALLITFTLIHSSSSIWQWSLWYIMCTSDESEISANFFCKPGFRAIEMTQMLSLILWTIPVYIDACILFLLPLITCANKCEEKIIEK